MTPAEVSVAYLASFSSGDPDVIAAWVTEDFVNEHTAALASGCQGRHEYRQRLPDFMSSLPGLHYEVEDVVAQGERVCVAYTLHAEIADRPVALRGVMRFRVAGERIAHRIDYWDSLVFQRQVGPSLGRD